MDKLIHTLANDNTAVSRRLKLALSGIALAAAITVAAASQMFFSSLERKVASAGNDMGERKHLGEHKQQSAQSR